jgi:hypothetical protein
MLRKYMVSALAVACVTFCIQRLGTIPAEAATDKAEQKAVPVHLVVTDEAQNDGDVISTMTREDVKVKQGKKTVPVTDWIPARGEQAALQLFILIDETCNTSLGQHLADLKEFINAQPATTWIGLRYARNTTVTIAENLTADHDKVAKAVRLPLGSVSAQDSIYLSLVDLMKRWPESKVRREILVVGDGIDRLRGNPNGSGVTASDPMAQGGFDASQRGMPAPRSLGMNPGGMDYSGPYMSPDVDQASQVAQRTGVIVHSIYVPGVGHYGRNYYDMNNGQNGIAKLSDETGGESFFLGFQTPVSFKPNLERLQRILGFRCENPKSTKDGQLTVDYAAIPNSFSTNFICAIVSPFATRLALPFLIISIASIPRSVRQAVGNEPYPLASHVRRFTFL